MKIFLEDRNDDILRGIENRWLEPDEYEEDPTFYIKIDADLYNRETGESINLVIDKYEIVDYNVRTEDAAEEYIRDNIEEILFDQAEDDRRFDKYETFDDFDVIINDIDILCHSPLSYTYESLNEANGNLKQQIELYLYTLLQETFEQGLVQTLYGKINGYDPDWAADSYDSSYDNARKKFIDETMRILFENFENFDK